MAERDSADTIAAQTAGLRLEQVAADARLERGDPLGRYVVLAREGAGGMGEVYSAYDPELDRKVAVKLLLPQRSGDGTEGHTRLQREAQAMARLSHPNVITVHDVGTLGDRVFVAMEFIDGVTLTQWLAQRDREWREVVEVFVAAGRGLAAAHAKALVHRDFKPDNVMIGDDGRVRVMDFGLARSVTSDEAPTDDARPRVDSFSVDLTGAGSLMGTPAYMAPEQFLGAGADARTDQFSFCVSLFEALYGVRPFDGDSLAALSYAVTIGKVREPPPGAAVPAWLRKVVVQGLLVKADARFASMEMLLEALQSHPGRARRRWLTALGGVAIVGAAFGGKALLDESARASCDEAGGAIAQTWSDERRAELAASMDQTGLPYARETTPRIAALLDEFTGQWRTARVSVCVDSLETGSEAQAALDCLEDRRNALAALLEVLADPTPEVVENSVRVAAQLPRVEQCLDATWLTRHPPPPAEVRDEVRRMERRLRVVAARRMAGRLLEAGQGLDALTTEVDGVDWERLRIRVVLERALLEQDHGRRNGAAALSEEAFFAASRAGYDDLVAGAAISLGYALGAEGSDVPRGWFWARMAEAAMARAGEQRGTRHISWLHLTADLLRREGEWEASQDRYAQALAEAEEWYGPRHPKRAALFNNQAILRADMGDYEGARDSYRRALQLRSEVLGDHHPDVADSLNNLANLERRAGNYVEARRQYERAMELWRAVLGDDHERIAYGLNNLGEVEAAQDHYAEAEALYSEAAALMEGKPGYDERDLATVLDNLGTAYMRQARYAAAEKIFDRVLAIRGRTAGENHPEYATGLNNLANVRRYSGALDSATELYAQALAIQRASLGARHPYVAITLMNLGDIELLRDEATPALQHFEEGLAIAEETLGPDHALTANALAGLGRARMASGQTDQALPSLERALKIADRAELPAEVDAGIRFALARALTAAETTAQPRALALAAEAETGFGEAGPTVTAERDEVARWLVAHAPTD